MNAPSNLFYTKDHEWVLFEGNIATIGITDHAQEALGDVVFVELPAVNENVTVETTYGVVESTKAVSDLISCVDGVITDRNDMVIDSPEKLNEDPYGEAWLIKVKFTKKSAELMPADEYQKYVEEEH
jgi:glycine cleavage system H protein